MWTALSVFDKVVLSSTEFLIDGFSAGGLLTEENLPPRSCVCYVN